MPLLFVLYLLLLAAFAAIFLLCYVLSDNAAHVRRLSVYCCLLGVFMLLVFSFCGLLYALRGELAYLTPMPLYLTLGLSLLLPRASVGAIRWTFRVLSILEITAAVVVFVLFMCSEWTDVATSLLVLCSICFLTGMLTNISVFLHNAQQRRAAGDRFTAIRGLLAGPLGPLLTAVAALRGKPSRHRSV